MEMRGSVRFDRLNREQIIEIYTTYMEKDFPAQELKPLNIILTALDQGEYECFGLMKSERLVGYVCMKKQETNFLIDYLAIVPEHRVSGLGGELLGLLRTYLSHADSIVFEAEDPEGAKDEKDYAIRMKRVQFYEKNGLVNTGVRVWCFGVPYIILEMITKEKHSEDEIRKIYIRHYKTSLSREMFEKNILV